MHRFFLVLCLAATVGACADHRSLVTATTAPSPAPFSAPPASEGVAGFVVDTAGRSIAGARVEVLDGPEPGSSVVTDVAGQFSLAGTSFRAGREGYAPATQNARTSAPGGRPWVVFYLEPLALPPVNLSGDYTLTLMADGACTDLPDEARTRTYAATVTPVVNAYNPVNTLFDVAVSGGTLLSGYQISIGVAGNELGFWLYGGHNPFLVEQLAPNNYLAFSGWAPVLAVGASDVSTISTSFEGSIEYCQVRSPMASYYACTAYAPARCESANHRLVLTRR